MNEDIISQILQMNFATAFDTLCTNEEKFDADKLEITDEELINKINQIKNGIKLKFNIYYYLNGEFNERPLNGIVTMTTENGRKRFNYVEFFEEINKRKAIMKNLLIDHFSYKIKPTKPR